MSLVTRCPACSTPFKVVRDQLRISEGWVRCGRCSHVFDATLDLHEASDMAAGSAAEPPPLSHSVRAIEEDDADLLDDDDGPEAAAAVPVAVERPTEVLPPLPAHGLVADEPWSDLDEARASEWTPPPSPLRPFPNIDLNLGSLPPQSRAPASQPPASAGGEDSDDSDESDERSEAGERSSSDQAQIEKVLRRARIKSARLASVSARAGDERQAPTPAPPASLMVVRAASEPDGAFPAAAAFDDESEAVEPFSTGAAEHGNGRAEFWHRPAVRRGLAVLVAAAVVLLIVQMLRHERDGIVARQPGLRPALSALCKATGCELSALHRIGDIVVVGAAFARERSGGNDYQLSFTLRNGAPVPLAMPAVEVSLLDTREQAVVRRVLMPADFGAPAVLAARTERSVSVPLALSEAGAAALPPIVGYGVEPFYP